MMCFLAFTAPIDTRPPDVVTVVLSGLLAVFLTLTVGWALDLLVTSAHEGSHALVAAIFGVPIRSISIKPGEGATQLEPPGLGAWSVVPVTIASYLGPPAFGLLACVALAHGRTDVVLWGSLGLLLVLLGFTNNWLGRVGVAAMAAAVFAAAHHPSPDLHVWVACTLTWALLVGGLSTAVQHRVAGVDHHDLREATMIPASCWGALSVLAALAALIVGGLILLGGIAVDQ